jgi:hypothetical protein
MAEIYRLLLTAPPGVPFDLTLNEHELADEVTAYIGERTSIPVRRIAVDLHPDQIAVTVDLKLGFLWSTVRASGQVWAEDRTIGFRIDQLWLGRAPAPAFLRQRIHDYAHRLVAPIHMPVEIDLLAIEPGRIRVAGRTKRHVLP